MFKLFKRTANPQHSEMAKRESKFYEIYVEHPNTKRPQFFVREIGTSYPVRIIKGSPAEDAVKTGSHNLLMWFRTEVEYHRFGGEWMIYHFGYPASDDPRI